MFGIPGKQAVAITDKAAAQIAKLMAKDRHQGLRIGVKKGGSLPCSFFAPEGARWRVFGCISFKRLSLLFPFCSICSI